MAYVLISTRTGAEKDILEQLKKLEFVKEARAVYGIYNIIAKVEVDSFKSLKKHVSSIGQMEKIFSTSTLPVTDQFK